MIKHTELRCGNLVYNAHLKENRAVDYLDIRDHAEGRLVTPFRGIELTPEWLIKLGFDERCSWFHFDVHDDLGLRYEPVEDLLVIYDNDESSIQLKNIKHVHQIQNLFFDLTAAKLELKK